MRSIFSLIFVNDIRIRVDLRDFIFVLNTFLYDSIWKPTVSWTHGGVFFYPSLENVIDIRVGFSTQSKNFQTFTNVWQVICMSHFLNLKVRIFSRKKIQKEGLISRNHSTFEKDIRSSDKSLHGISHKL